MSPDPRPIHPVHVQAMVDELAHAPAPSCPTCGGRDLQQVGRLRNRAYALSGYFCRSCWEIGTRVLLTPEQVLTPRADPPAPAD